MSRCPRLLGSLLLLVALRAWGSQIDIQGDLNDTVFAKGKEHSVWTGNAVLKSEDTTIYADRIDLWGKDFVYAEAEGNLRVVNREKEIYLSCDRLSYDRQTRFLTALGNVYMEDRKNGVVVKADSLQYDDERDETIVQIRVRIFGDEEDFQARAEFARYRRAEELLVLSGTPYVLWKEDEYRAVQISITLEDKKVKSVRMVEGSGKITTKEETASEKAPAGSPQPSGTAPSGAAPAGAAPEATPPAATATPGGAVTPASPAVRNRPAPGPTPPPKEIQP